jgi:Tfp pilus assembly protein PilX
MTAWAGRFLANERGMVLFASLVLLAVLMAVGVGALVSVQNEFRVSANVTAGTSASYLADSGIEWAKDQLSKTTTNPPILEDRSQTFRSGSFAVAFLASARRTPLSAQVVVRSVGSQNFSSQTVQAQIAKNYDLTDAAVALRGNSRGVNFSGDAFSISGTDFDPAMGASVPGAKPRAAISLSSESLRAQVENGLSDVQRSHVISGSPDRAAVAQSDKIPGPTIAQVANDLCASAGAQITVVPDTGNLTLANQTWGTRSAPQIQCVRGLAETGDSVVVGGNFRGAGILVVQDVEWVGAGAFYWEGLIIVTGDHVGFRVEGAESKEVFGGLIVNETGALSGPGPALFDIRGSITIFFSRSALGNVAGLIPSASLAQSYPALPFTVTQDYWRAVNP